MHYWFNEKSKLTLIIISSCMLLVLLRMIECMINQCIFYQKYNKLTSMTIFLNGPIDLISNFEWKPLLLKNILH